MRDAAIATLALALLSACIGDDRSDWDVDTQAIVGGDISVGFPSAMLIGGRCTGTLITPRVVLTAAHCGIGIGDRANVMDVDTTLSRHQVIGVHHHRLYNDQGGVASADVTVALLIDEPPIAPTPYPTAELSGLLASEIISVGFGLNEPETGGGFGTKRQARFAIDYVNDEILQGEGIEGQSICSGDSGGPAFLETAGGVEIVGIARSGSIGCTSNSTWTRVDTYAEGFIIPAIDALEGPCAFDGDCVTDGCRTPDPDCAPCGLDGVCSSGCDPIDLDCPRKLGFNAACSVDDDCESLVCIDRENGAGRFCSRRCGPSEPCPDQSSCSSEPEGDVCVRAALVETPSACFCQGSGDPADGLPWIAGLVLLGWRGTRRRR